MSHTSHPHPSHLADNLAQLRRETVRLVRTASGFDDDAVRADSLCAGWTRAHVLTHIARNADGMSNLVAWATTGVPTPQYASDESRDADIAAGALRSAAELLTDLEDSAGRFAEAAEGLAGDAEEATVRGRGGRTLRGGDLPTARLREVVFHHVDLAAGYDFSDADPGFVRRALNDAVRRVGGASSVPSLRLHSDEGDQWSVGGGGTEVSGTNAALLLWLARGVADGVRCAGPLPDLPPWG